MKNRDERSLLLGDTSIPDLFIADHMPLLDPFALKVYLLLAQATAKGRELSLKQLSARLGLTERKVQQALAVLVETALIRLDDQRIRLIDLKAQEVDRYVERESQKRQAKIEPGLDSERTRTVQNINDTFFQGAMSHRWYNQVDTWFSQYHFQPEVVYTLFSKLVDYDKLAHFGYAQSMAENWHRRGIRTFEQLAKHENQFKAMRDLAQQVAKKLRITLDDYSEALIAKWYEELGYGMDIVDIALQKSVRLANAKNLEIYDRMLRSWFAAGCKTTQDVETFEHNRRQTTAAKDGARRDNRGNYSVQGEASQFNQAWSDELEDIT